MEPEPGNACEVEGVLNPAVARGLDGALYLLPRLVAAGNYSRIGLARVIFDRRGDPVGVERLGTVLEPETAYERNAHNGGGVEDPRVTFLSAWRLYVMTYTAYGPAGPRIAVAVSANLRHWTRLGLVRFAVEDGLDLNCLDNKDAVLFPEPISGPDGGPALALIHRPTFDGPRAFRGQSVDPPGIWISYASIPDTAGRNGLRFQGHRLVASPQAGWEHLKIGAGTPPLRVGDSWMLLYHGVAGHISEGIDQQKDVCYCAGVMFLDWSDPSRVVNRTSRPVLEPSLESETSGVVGNVVFPSGLDARPGGRFDVYYGMADTRIGVARAYIGQLDSRSLRFAA